MNKKYSILVLVLPSLLVGAEPGQPVILDLESCIDKAFTNNVALRLAQDDLAVARARSRTAFAGLLPAITAKAEETRGRADEEVEDQPFVHRLYGAQATQTIFAGGRVRATHRQASLAYQVAKMQHEKQRLEVRHQVMEAYWRVAAFERAMAVHKETYALLQEDLEKAARHELSAARAARIELLSTRAQSRDSEAALAETEEELITARIALMDAIGQRVPLDFRVHTELPKGTAKVNEEEALRLANQHRPELRIAENLMESARLSRKIGRSYYYPKIDLNGFYGRSGSAFVETESLNYQKDWNAGVSASWPIFGNSVKYSAFREKTSPRLGESSRTETENQTVALSLGDALGNIVTKRESDRSFHEEEWRYDKGRRDLEMEVRLAVRRAATTRSRREGAKARYEESQQGMKDARALLQDDRAHLGDLAAARNRAAFAEAAYYQAQSNYLIALSALNRAIGVADHYRPTQ